MTTPAGPSALAEPHLSTEAESIGSDRRTRAMPALRQIGRWACWIFAVSTRVFVTALTRAVLALPQIVARICWFFAVLAFGFSVGALFWWPGDIGETDSAWALDATVLLVSTGFFVKTNHGGKLLRNAVPLLVSLVALVPSHPALAALVGEPLAVLSSFIVTGITLFYLVAVSRRRSASPA